MKKEEIIEVLKKYLVKNTHNKSNLYREKIIRASDIESIASELTEKESEVRTAEEILMGILESFDMYLRKAYGEIRFNYDDAAGFVKKLYISDEFASQFQQPEITNIEIILKKISAGVYLKFHNELNLSLDDCEKITEFIIKEHADLIWGEQPSESNPRIRSLGIATTIGELKKLIKNYPDDTSFGFRNQPMQKLYEVKYGDDVFVTFQ